MTTILTVLVEKGSWYYESYFREGSYTYITNEVVHNN